MKKHRKRISAGGSINAVLLLFLAFATAYPFLYLLSISLSDPALLARKGVILLPRGIDFSTYEYALSDERLLLGYKNTLIAVALDIVVGVLFTMMMAYPLAVRSGFTRYSNIIMKFVLVTMYFSGGLIPTYLVVRGLGLIDTFWALCLPGAVSSFHLIIARTFIRELPSELYDAASIDGANEVETFIKIVLPLSMPIVAVIIMYRAVGTWNSFFSPLLYLNSPDKYPLQIYLRELVIETSMVEFREVVAVNQQTFPAMSIKACVLVLSTLPILIAYPFLQKYFVKGMTIGAVKG